MSSSRFPAAADAFIHAIRSASTDEFISTLHEQAVLHDGGRDYAGPALRAWADDYFRRGPIALRLINRDWENGALVLTVLSGTGHGPAVDGPFDWQIQIDGNQIRRWRMFGSAAAECRDSLHVPVCGASKVLQILETR